MVRAGAWVANQLTAWQQVADARIVALCERAPERLHPMAERFGIPGTYSDFSEMLGREAGFYRHLLCTSLQEAKNIVSDCETAGVRLMVNENYRWQARYRKAKELLESDVIGEPFMVKIHKRWRVTLPRFEILRRTWQRCQN
jgi:predicted dehydrogenase